MTNIINIIARVQDQATQKLDRLKQKINGVGHVVGMLAKRLQNFLLGVGLSILFTGMAIKRMADSALRALINTYATVMDDTAEFSVLTNRLSANWEFFKFTLMDALMQSGIFQGFISFLISVIRFLSNLPLPVKIFIVFLLAIAIVMGALMMIFGQFALSLLGLLAIYMLFGVAGLAVTGIILFGFLVVAAAAVALFAIWGSGMSTIKKVAATILVVFVALALLIGFFPALLVVAFGLIIAGLIFVSKNWDTIWTNMKLVFKRVWLEIVEFFEWVINGIIKGINAAIRAANALGANLNTVSEINISGGIRESLVADVIAAQNRGTQGESAIQQTNTINITQEPGEDQEGLAERILGEMSNLTDRMVGSPQR